MMSAGNISRIELLNKNNFDTWKLQMQAVLIKNDLWEFVSGANVKPEPGEGNDAAIQAWKKGDSKARSDIILSISPNELKQVKNCVTSKDMWTKLQETYQSQGPARKATLLKRLTLHKMTDGGDIRDHMNEFFDTVDKLADMDIEVHPDQQAIMLLYSLPVSFENFRCAIESRDTLPTPEALRAKIIEESEARKNDTIRDAPNAMFARKSYSRNQPKNAGSDRRHTENDKDKSDETKIKRENHAKIRCNLCKRLGHKKADCWYNNKNKPSAKLSENVGFYTTDATAHAASDSTISKWCLDSGATTHLCNDEQRFANMDTSKRGTLNLATDSSTEIKGKGTVHFSTNVAGNRKGISLNDTSCVPDLRTNLLSVAKITDHNFEVLFKKSGAYVMDADGRIELYANRIGDLYFVHEQTEVASAVSSENKREVISLELLHKRLGHLNAKDISNAIRADAITGFRLKDPTAKLDCDTCLKGKFTRTPFPKASSRKTELLELIHTDVCGPMRKESLGGAKYYVEFIDDATRWCEVRFLKSKADVFKATTEYIALIEKQKGKNVKTLQSDNGREYLNQEFDEYLKKHGITRRLTVPHNPEQNGIAERKNRTLIEAARCLLLDSGLPLMFWAEAVNTANYLRNRSPTSSLNGRTPYEAWTGRAPNLSYLKIFGSAVTYLDRDPGQGKFDQRGKEGIFLGYAEESKAFRIWSTEKKKVIVSRDVKFHEVAVKFEEKHSGRIEISSEMTNGRVGQRFVDFDHGPNEMMEDEIPESDLDNSLGSDFHGFDVPPLTDEDEDYNDEEEVLPQHNREDEVLQPVEEEDEVALRDTPATSRGRGRPTILRTGQRGRPRKLYQPGTTGEVDFAESSFISEIPLEDALKSPEASEWHQAIATEMKSIIRNGTWTLVDRPKQGKIIGSRMVLRNKVGPDGEIEKRKARLVAQGFSQQPGVHFQETFAPVARFGSIRLMMSLAIRNDMKVKQFDITTAYLNGELDEDILMEAPKFYEEILQNVIRSEGSNSIGKQAKAMLRTFRKGNQVCLLKKALYGLRQAGRSWYIKLSEVLKKLGASPTISDPCLFKIGSEKDVMLIAVYVDDILVASRNENEITKFGRQLAKEFEVKDLGDVSYCLGVEFIRTRDEIALSQRGYIQELLQRFNMMECKPVTTPMDSGTKLVKTSGVKEEDQQLPYRELVGALTYLSTMTRPDIAFAVRNLSQFNNCYSTEHWKGAKRVLRYLKGTSNLGLVYKSKSGNLEGFVDADWGNNIEDRKSYSGYLFSLGGSAISWDSRKQKTVALSTTEAEYMAASECAKEAVYLQKFVRELGFKDLAEIVIYCDNKSALCLAENPTFHNRSKHIAIRHHFVRDLLKNKILSLKYVSTENQIADFLTKGLTKKKHQWCTEKTGLKSIDC